MGDKSQWNKAPASFYRDPNILVESCSKSTVRAVGGWHGRRRRIRLSRIIGAHRTLRSGEARGSESESSSRSRPVAARTTLECDI
jgi:hypothetical protein